MDLKDIKAFLETNKSQPDVQTYLGELSALSADKVKGFLDTDEGKRLVQPELDRYHAKSLTTWKDNNLNKLVEDELKKRNPDKSPDALALEVLQKRFDDSEKAGKREKLMNTAIKQASDKGLPVDLLDFFISDDEESTTANIGKLEAEFTKALTTAVDAKFKAGGRTFGNTDDKTKDTGAYGKKIAENTASKNTGLEEARKSYFE